MKHLFCTTVFWISCLPLVALAQTGGTYDLSHSVIASGGDSQSTGGSFKIDGTIGQPVAGMLSGGANYTIAGGFWVYETLVPTAAQVSVSGRVTASDGTGIPRARLTLTAAAGSIKTALSSSFGYYRFENVEAGQTYILSITSKRFVFAQPIRVINIDDELRDVDFVALPNSSV